VGALVRNCAAFKVQALLIGETSSSPFLRRAVRSSMGTVFQLPIVECAGLVATLQALRARGFRCIAAHPHVSGKTLAQCNLVNNCCLAFGSEGYGLAPATLAACDEAVAIPMSGEIDSLNVSSAAAVFLYETDCQRTARAA
jgi:TrmH family RNA methyltransferase